MDTIKFANGAIYDCSFLATVPGGRAFIALSGVTFTEAAQIFSNEDMTAEMEWGGFRLVGYTALESLCIQPYGIQATLTGGYDERI